MRQRPQHHPSRTPVWRGYQNSDLIIDLSALRLC
jgi:hypothetical protein